LTILLSKSSNIEGNIVKTVEIIAAHILTFEAAIPTAYKIVLKEAKAILTCVIVETIEVIDDIALAVPSPKDSVKANKDSPADSANKAPSPALTRVSAQSIFFVPSKLFSLPDRNPSPRYFSVS
jgi:hypothetical protein